MLIVSVNSNRPFGPSSMADISLVYKDYPYPIIPLLEASITEQLNRVDIERMFPLVG